MRVWITHRTRLDYDAEIVESVIDARLGPLSDRHQRWDRFDLRVTPQAHTRRYVDGFGNTAHLITVAKPHREIEVVVTAEVDTLLEDPFAPPRAAPPPLGPGERSDHTGPSPLVPADPGLADIARQNAPEGPTFGSAHRLMRYVHEGFTYKPEVTDVATTVAEVLETRTGVCQDLAHVLVGLYRAVGMPARYVSGYVVGGDERSPAHGGTASHAWVECWTETHGWRGFDPTNGVLASEHHAKMAIGRDYRDVSPTRGSFRGAASERLTVEVVARAV